VGRKAIVKCLKRARKEGFMKHMKKVITLLLAVVMTLAMSSVAFAATGDKIDPAEDTITATNVKAGDSVSYYQLVEWKDNNWNLTTLGQKVGIPVAQLVDGITEAEATKIAEALATETATGSMTAGTPATTFTATSVAAGLYYLKAVPAADNMDTVYNPAFVSADYFEGGNTVDFSSKIGNSTVMKKTGVPFDKEVDGDEKYIDTKPGDIIPFKVTTTIPSYGTSFKDPKFEINDVLSEGLTLEGNVSVKYGTHAAVTATNDDVEITKTASGYTVKFSKEYLTGLNGETPAVEITYSAKVTTDAPKNVNALDNTATLKFSNTPTTTKDKSDKTRHYTFSIDGGLLGGGSEVTKELIKSGTDKNGQPITTETVYYNEKKAAPLSGAGFTLYSDAACKTVVKEEVDSTADGRITFNGLDAGTYYLKETTVPNGYIGDTRVFTVTITPTYGTGENADLLLSYDITITAPASGSLSAYSGGATFEMNNAGGVTVSSKPGTDTSFINNTQGAELPSTGGIGTVIFYVLGSLLVVGCGIVLISKRRMNSTK